MSDATSPTYWDYLNLDRLLSLQGGLEGDESKLGTDELHFIIVHQAYELWFKLMLKELELGRDHLSQPVVPEEAVPYVVHHLGRVSSILSLLVDQFEVMETLTPQDFLAFRDKLTPASGFQSFQMRELEILLGLEDDDRPATGIGDPLAVFEEHATDTPAGHMALQRIARARNGVSLRNAMTTWLHRTPIQGSSPGDPEDERVVGDFIEAYLRGMHSQGEAQAALLAERLRMPQQRIREQLENAETSAREFLLALDGPEASRARVRRARAGLLFIESYRELPLLSWPRVLIDAVVELEEQLVLFRGRHARMVERIIGRRVGTGGSPGVDYLDATARTRIFSELWTVRTLLMPPEHLPPLQRGDVYGFATP